MIVMSACVLAFAGCVTSPFLNEDQAKRIAAVDALTDQRKLAEVALDYCTEPYQELPTGCQMDVRRHAVERLTDRDLLMSVASFSVIKAKVKGKRCYVTLGEANAELRKMALNKLTEGRYIAEILSANDPFAIQPLFEKALFGYYKIAGQMPDTAKEAWYMTAKGKEKSVAKAFCTCLEGSASTALCKEVFSLLPASPSAETLSVIKDAYKHTITETSDVGAAIRVLQLTAVLPESAIDKGDIDGMCKKICSKVSTISEFTALGSLINSDAKKYLSDPEGILKSAATQVVPKLNSMNEIAAFAEVLKSSSSLWIGQIGIEEHVRKCAKLVNNIEGLKTFAKQLTSFNDVMLPNKTDVAGDAVIAVLNGQKESFKDFAAAVAELPADILSDKAIVAIFKNEGIAKAYSSALRTDGYKEEMGNELAGAVMRSGSFGDLLAAGMIMSAMGDKESPMYTKMFSHLISIMRKGETFIEAAKYAKIYYPRNMLIEAAENRLEGIALAKCLLAVFEHSSKSSWVINKTLDICENFVIKKDDHALIAVQPILQAYIAMASSSGMNVIKYRALSCLTDPNKISTFLLDVDIDQLRNGKVLDAYMNSYTRASSLYKQQKSLAKGETLIEKMSECIANKIGSSDGYYIRNFEFSNSAKPLMAQITHGYPVLWAGVMRKVKLEPISPEFTNTVAVLSANPTLLVEFLHDYKCDAVHIKSNQSLPSFRKDGNWIQYSPYFTYGFDNKEPVYYYNCDWFSDAICQASKFELSNEDRSKLNEVMKFVAINALNLDTRKKVLEAIQGDSVREEIKACWDMSTRDIPKTTTALFNFCLDDSISKVKWENEWKRRYEYKRVRLRGKMIDVSQNEERRSDHRFTLILDGASDLTDMTFVKKEARKRPKGQIDRDLENARECLKQYQETWDSVKKLVVNGKIEINFFGQGKKMLSLKEYYDMMPFFGKKGKMPEEVIADQLKIVADLEAKANGSCEVSLLYEVEIPVEYKDVISELNKGDEVVFEAYPGRVRKQSVYRSDRGGLSERGPEENVFEASMSNGRIVPKE